MNREGKMHALLATARIANVPSVVSNVAVGVVIAISATADGKWPWWLFLGCILIYISANFLNDWADQKWDETHRPERALPRGLFNPRVYFLIGAFGLILGLGLISFYGLYPLLAGCILVVLVVLYTAVHKRVAWSVIPMGLCRACLPVLGVLAVHPDFLWLAVFPAGGLLCYVTGLSICARNEAKKTKSKRSLFTGKLLLVLGPVVAIGPMFAFFPAAMLGLIPIGIWLIISMSRYRSSVSEYVSALLAGIPLVDWSLMITISNLAIFLSGIAESNLPLLPALTIPPIAFVFGRLLQRVAPAT